MINQWKKKIFLILSLSVAVFLTPQHFFHALLTQAEVLSIERLTEIDGTALSSGNNYLYQASFTDDGEYIVFTSAASDLVPGDINEQDDIFVINQTTKVIERVSIATDGTQGDGASQYPSISADGRYVVFESNATNLVAGDSNNRTDIFVHDRQTGETAIVSIGDDDSLGNGNSSNPGISPDGRYVVFHSAANNLVEDDTNGIVFDVFVHDRQLETTERVSVATGGTEGDANSYLSSISSDGRYVIFTSFATNLVAGDTNAVSDLFVHDRQLNTTERINLPFEDDQANDESYSTDISADGRYVLFTSLASNLVEDDTNGAYDVFVHDRQLEVTERVSVTTDDIEGNDTSNSLSMSSDGRYVTYYSRATNLVVGDTNNDDDVFLRDRQLGTTERISVATNGTQSNGDSKDASITADGRYVVFASRSSNLGVLGVADDNYHIFLRDRQESTTTDVVSFLAPATLNGDSYEGSLSADNTLVAFSSEATNLVAGDTNGNQDVFVFNRTTSLYQRASVSTEGVEANGESYGATISANGRYVVFESDADNLVEDDTNDATDIFVHDLQTGITERVSIASDGTESDDSVSGADISADGRYVVFDSESDTLVVGDGNEYGDVFLHDRETGETTIVSVSTTGEQGWSDSEGPSISDDGQRVVFYSEAENLVAGDNNSQGDLFLRNLQTQETIRISEITKDVYANDSTINPTFSSDGNYFVFESSASTLVPGDTNGSSDIFFVDMATGEIERISVSTAGTQGVSSSYSPDLSDDGRYVVFHSSAYNLVTGDTNNQEDVFLRDRQTNTTTRISVKDDGTEGDDYAAYAKISDNGQYVTFFSFASNILSTPMNGSSNVYRYDVQNESIERVSFPVSGVDIDNNVFSGGISADGRYVVFLTNATNVVSGDTNNQADIFIRDMQEETTTRIVAEDTSEANGYMTSPSISADGQYIAFSSAASNLVSGDTNNQNDIFRYSLQTGAIERVSVSSDEEESNGSPLEAIISPNGQYVIFNSFSDNLVIGDNNNQRDLFIRDIVAGTTELVNISTAGTQGDLDIDGGFSLSADGRYVLFASESDFVSSRENTNLYIRDRQEDTTVLALSPVELLLQISEGAQEPAISADGRFVAFMSDDDIFVSDDTNNVRDVFVYTIATKEFERVSISSNNIEGNDGSGYSISISADGRYVAFYSNATNLVLNDTNNDGDIFVRDRTLGQTLLVSLTENGQQIADLDNDNPIPLSADGKYIIFSVDTPGVVSGDVDENNDLFLVRLLPDSTPTSSPPPRSSAPLNLSPAPSGPINNVIPNTPNPEQPTTPPDPIINICNINRFDSYLRRGSVGIAVTKVQQFLTTRGFYSGPITEYFGPLTQAGVNRFQSAYKTEILSPWSLTSPTGFWGITTRAMANKLQECSEGAVTLPSGATIEF